MQAVRFFIASMVSCVISLAMFIVVQKMLTNQHSINKKSESGSSFEFVRLIRDEQPLQRKQIIPPKKPPPPKKKPAPPKVSKLEANKPLVTKIKMPPFRLQTELNLKDALYLGDFQKKPDMQQSFTVDAEVVPLVRIAPRYPRRAARQRIEGWVEMEITINATGSVVTAAVTAAKPRRVFNRAALQAIKKWRFRPKVVDGKPVARNATQRIEFKLN